MRDIAAPYVKKPCTRVRRAHKKARRVFPGNRFLNPLNFRCRVFTREGVAMKRNRRVVSGGAIHPKGIDRVWRARFELKAGFDGFFAQRFESGQSMEGGIVTNRAAFGRVRGDGGRHRRLETLNSVERLVHLGLRLKRVAAIDEEDGNLFENQGLT